MLSRTVPSSASLASSHALIPALAYGDLRVRWAVGRARAAGLQPNDEFRGLYISDDQVDALLGSDFGRNFGFHVNGHNAEWENALRRARADAYDPNTPLAQLQTTFCLSDIETDCLLLALLPELDRRYERIYAYLQDDVTQKRPTVDLLLNLLTDAFDHKLTLRHLFDADSQLLRSRLLTTFAPASVPEPPLLSHFVRPAPRVVAHLLGHHGVDERLADCAQLVVDVKGSAETRHLPQELFDHLDEKPIFAFLGGYGAGQIQSAHHIAYTLNAPLLRVDLAATTEKVSDILRLTFRDAGLSRAIVMIEGWDKVLTDGRPPLMLMEQLLAYNHIVITSGENEWHPQNKSAERHIYPIRFEVPVYDTRHIVWEHELAEPTLNVARVANHFRFTPGQIRDAVATARDLAAWERQPIAESHLLAAGRAHSNQKLSELATKIRPHYSWDDIILPRDTLQILREMVSTVQNKPAVYDDWGFGKKLSLGKGLNALFAGESGTGKTMAADIIAHHLGLDLYKIDLSTVVSKYIGETEKNLGKIFHEAETSNAVLFFDEADALFGKRSEVKDSHDRYANIETGYLLQRMEAFDGIVILATNLRANLDEAFTRRLHFIVEFPFPEASDREHIWRVNVPSATPLADDVDFNLLAHRFRITGGAIRNIILAAAFLAAEENLPIHLHHILHAARREYQKRGRLINEALFVVS